MTSTSVNVRLPAALADHVESRTGEAGTYDNSSEFIRDLIRQDMNRQEQQSFERLRAELQRAFGESADDVVTVSAADVIRRNATAEISS